MGTSAKCWLAALLAVVVIPIVSSSDDSGCSSQCAATECVDPGVCLAGKVLDGCGCCQVCGREEGELCDTKEDSSHNFGKCGQNLMCRINPFTDLGQPMMETLCYCEREEVVCGSDGKTYTNICQLTAASINETYYGRKEITVENIGKPCPSEPWIAGAVEERHYADIGKPYALICEGFGYPTPSIEWYKEGEEDMTLPCNHRDIAVQVRGGPENYQVTSWIQFQEVKKSNQGKYWCVAKNTHGEAKVVVYLGALDQQQQAEKSSWYDTQQENRRAQYLKYYSY